MERVKFSSSRDIRGAAATDPLRPVKKGEVVELPDDVAAYYVNRGVAVPVKGR